MLLKSKLIGLVVFICLSANAQVIPAIGSDNSIDVANWNLNWFGKTTPGFGPSDDSTQQALVDSVILSARIDLWIFSEVCDTNLFNLLLAGHGNLGHTYSKYQAEQKNAIVFDNKLFKLGQVKMLGTNSKDSFSTGRYPLQVQLIPKKASVPDTFYVIALHLKANTGNDSQKMIAYNSRKKSSDWLSNYLKNQMNGKRVLIGGDWNDDLDFSIYNNLPSPLIACKNLNPQFIFLTQKLTDDGISTTTGFDNPIDHQLASHNLFNFYTGNSTFVWRLDQILPSYSQNCSDHLPVVSRFSVNLTSTENINIPISYIYRDNQIYLSIPEWDTATLWDLSGRSMDLPQTSNASSIDLNGLMPGLYLLEIQTGQVTTKIKILVQP